MRVAVVIIFGVLLAYGCRSTKTFVKAKKMPIKELLGEMREGQIDYEFFSAKAKMKLEGDDMRMTGRANIRMIKDSLIWMNFKKLSIEGGRALIKQDSFWIIYRLDNMYESGTYQELMDAYDLHVTFSELQDLIVGNLPIPDRSEVTQYRTKDLHDLQFVQSGYRYRYGIDGQPHVVDFDWSDAFGREVSGTMSGYDATGFAKNKSIHAKIEDGSSGHISMSFTSVEFDEPKKIRFEVPKHYRRLP